MAGFEEPIEERIYRKLLKGFLTCIANNVKGGVGMDIEFRIIESGNYTNYSFENELKRVLGEIGCVISSFSYGTAKEKIGFFRRKEVDMILITITIEGVDEEDDDKLEVISIAIDQAAEDLSLDLYWGI